MKLTVENTLIDPSGDDELIIVETGNDYDTDLIGSNGTHVPVFLDKSEGPDDGDLLD